MSRKKWDRTISRLTKKAEAGDPRAQWELGSWIEDGLTNRRGVLIVPENPRAALRWFRLSAAAGNSNAQIHLGNYLSSGTCTRKDEKKAIYWYKRSLPQGASTALNNIASVYRNRGNHRRALFWYRKAAAQGDGGAFLEIGVQYYKGRGVRKNSKHAVNCFRKAIRSRDISQLDREIAMYHLGIAYREGNGVKQSDVKALEWFSLANRDDDFPAARKMAKTIKHELSRTP